MAKSLPSDWSLFCLFVVLGIEKDGIEPISFFFFFFSFVCGFSFDWI